MAAFEAYTALFALLSLALFAAWGLAKNQRVSKARPAPVRRRRWR
jgi:hypothetical protein